jgi:hypothetical protein
MALSDTTTLHRFVFTRWPIICLCRDLSKIKDQVFDYMHAADRVDNQFEKEIYNDSRIRKRK